MKVITLDFGHGGNDNGASYQNVKEKEIVLKIGKEVIEQLKQYDVKVITTRDKDKTVSLNERVVISNKNNSDIFVSIHCNSFVDVKACGIETYCYNIKTNNNLAKTIHDSILTDKKLYQKNRGIKENSFYVLKNTNCKACLVELAFLSNVKDREKLLNYTKDYAKVIAQGIVKYLSLSKKSTPLFRVCTGTFSVKENALKMKKELEEKGYEPFIYTVEN